MKLGRGMARSSARFPTGTVPDGTAFDGVHPPGESNLSYSAVTTIKNVGLAPCRGFPKGKDEGRTSSTSPPCSSGVFWKLGGFYKARV